MTNENTTPKTEVNQQEWTTPKLERESVTESTKAGLPILGPETPVYTPS